MNADLSEQLLERKFILAVIAQLMSLALVGFGKIDGEQWTTLNMVVYGGFTLGSIGDQIKGK